MEKKTHRNGLLILFPLPYQGHISPMIQLGSILYSKGFSITIAHTNFNSPNPQNHPHFSFLPLRDGLTSHEIEHGVVDKLVAINNNCKEILQQLLEKLREEKQEEITCIISDEYMYFCEEVANNLKLPSITLNTTSAATTLARPGLVQLRKEGQIPCQGMCFVISVTVCKVTNIHSFCNKRNFTEHYKFKDLLIQSI